MPRHPRRSRRRTTRSMQRRWIWIIIVIALCAVGVLDRRGLLLVRDADDIATYHGRQAIVTRIIDGDTLEITLPDRVQDRSVTRVRLWGIDAPEQRRFGTNNEPEPYALDATALARSRADGEIVTLWLEPQRTRGVYGRLLAHVEFADGSSLNEALLEAGLAQADDRWPHTRMIRYAQLENAARRKKVGIWAK